MINLLGAVLDRSNSALTMECKDGIINGDGISVCNVTRKSGVPYYLLELDEVVDGKVINHGYSIMFGKITHGEVCWDLFGPSTYQKTLKTGKHSFRWVIAILNFDGSQYIDKPEEEFFDFLKQWIDIDRNIEFGRFETRRVRPYADCDGKEKNKYTCYLFSYEHNSEEQIIKIFGYHGKKVLGGSIIKQVNQELSEV